MAEVEDALIGYRKLCEAKESQRSLFSAQLDEVQAISGQLISVVRPYKALGGGWPYSPDVPAEEPARTFLIYYMGREP